MDMWYLVVMVPAFVDVGMGMQHTRMAVRVSMVETTLPADQ
jgi:hypothetical protein